MRKILLPLLILFSFVASAQTLQYVNTYGYDYNKFKVRDLLGLPTDTFTVPANLQAVPFIARKSNVLYFWNTSTLVWEVFTGGGSSIDSTLASQGNQMSGDTVVFAGPIGTPGVFSNERTINTNRLIMHWTNGIPAEAGGALWQFSQRPYSPYQFISQDTLPGNDAFPSYARPLSGMYARRTVYFPAGTYKTQQSYGHYFGQTYSWADTMVHRNDGMDYQQAMTVEQRYKPRGSGYQVMRMANGTGNDARLLHATGTLVANTYYDAVDNASTDTLFARGYSAGVTSYLVAATGSGKIRSSGGHVYFLAGSLQNANSYFPKTYVLARQTNETYSDTSYMIWDTLRTSRSVLRNVVVGHGDSLSSGAQFKVYGSSLFNGWSGYWANVAANYTARSFTDKNYVDSAIAAGGTPGIDDVLAIGQSLTTGRTISAGASSLTVSGTGTPLNISASNTSATPAQTAIELTRTGVAGAVNMGVGIGATINNASSSTVSASKLLTRWSDPTAGSEDAYFDIQLVTAGAAPTTKLSVKNSSIITTNADADTLATKAYARSVGGGGGGSGADISLSNLSSVAINTSLISDADNTDDLGSATFGWKDAYIRRTLMKGSTSGTAEIKSDALSNTLSSTVLSGTGITPTEFVIYTRADETLANSNADQPVFTNTAHDVISITANTTYDFEIEFDLSHGAVSHNLSFGMLPTTATISEIYYNSMVTVAAIATATNTQSTNRVKTTATTQIQAAGANAVEVVSVKGWFTVGATGGSIMPTIKFSADPTGTVLLKAGCRFVLRPRGTNTFTEIGPIN